MAILTLICLFTLQPKEGEKPKVAIDLQLWLKHIIPENICSYFYA